MGKRNFEELSVTATGVQNLEDRFGKRRRRHDYDDLPPIRQWRCNLTGLSQEQNLYFVAYGQDVYVYVPQYPAQAVSSLPVLIVPSQPTRPDLTGFLDPREPHTINNLIVHHLGTDEVLATVRDDGDVEMVLVRHISQAITRRAESDNTLPLRASEVRPFFQENVSISAWGLSIHTQARILATSSNAHEVRIFKFGLLHAANDPSYPDLSHNQEELPDTGLRAPGPHSTKRRPSRQMDVTQRVINGETNVPYISFCNTGDDPEARWLLTTDIGGYCRIMDLHSDATPTTQKFRFGRSYLGQGGGFDRLNAGWAIMFLDRRSFLLEDTLHAAVGLTEGQSLPGIKGDVRMWDLSEIVDQVPNNSLAFTQNGVRTSRQAPDHIRQHERQNGSLEPGSPGIGATVDHDAQTPRDAIEMIVEQLVAQTAEAIDDEVLSSVPDDDPEGDIEDEYDDDIVHLVEDDGDPDDEGTEDTVSFNNVYGGRRIFGNQPYFYHQTGICHDLPCPILHASVKNVYLLQPSNQRLHPGPFSPPMVGMANPLRQAIQNQFAYLNVFDRLNMNAYIPALGVVVLASQKGRAVVLSLTKLAASTKYSAEMRGHLDRPKTDYAIRVECILPFAHQEMQNQRPFAPLHGIAVGPLQGTEGLLEEKKRWRLLMMYQDHSILSYEVKRQIWSDSVVEVGRVMV
ncbi:hypothetical protein BAUCODRAFT_24288 [Baudoinia panamericana UAMH 10762]|uniref:Uncharacterized protein n=1 Tax=Baudoinia panamericana (strain UAMH 10762) TaxID=717646 RepID=M2NCC7_BAUPA|nr:uncharacterized protein BAUCODRAFT_24288 [Baudoinia panamericana UAMH 10762]EMC96530.1 hypothetical protein BAUCODRAFT_24288 [Baudoinia panamericana UAMH 10762]